MLSVVALAKLESSPEERLGSSAGWPHYHIQLVLAIVQDFGPEWRPLCFSDLQIYVHAGSSLAKVRVDGPIQNLCALSLSDGLSP